MRLLLPVLLVVLVAAACSSDGDTVRTDAAPGTDLTVEVTTEPGASPERWTLTCDPTGGDHPEADLACAHLEADPEALAPLAPDAVCTEIYGGPQTAVVRGTARGEPVELELSRTDGCRIAQWERLRPVLPAAAS